jgi:NAD(P)-dependent dehydrogenase (short-subunit alcohol dehydrogenase family)
MNLPEYQLNGKRALVTGGGRGIGKGIALVLAEAGADVAITGLTTDGIGKVAAAIEEMGRKAIPVVGDATKPDEVDRVAQQVIDGFGGLDILVNCVGESYSIPVVPLPDREGAGMDFEQWREILDLNLSEAFLSCRAFGSHLLSQKSGSVINISSFAAYQAARRFSAYAAAKAGVIQFTRSLASEWGRYGVRVNGIAPGWFPDPEHMDPEEYSRREAQGAPKVALGRFGRPREVGLLAVFLASDASAYITGQTILIDGGLTLT